MKNTIENLQKLLLDDNCSRMNKSTIKGYLGELYVKGKLEAELDGEVKHLGNQSGYDLEIDSNILIDEKFSTIK
mgnify:CR=1 FL=1